LQFECDYLDVKKVKGYFEAKEKNVIFAESVFVPLNTAPMSEENVEQINQHQKHKSGRGPSNEHFWQVWLKSV
jgi:hypothetical protein